MQQEDDIKWAKWLSGKLPKEESDALSQSEDGKQLQSFLNSVDGLGMPAADTDKSWEAFVSKSGFPERAEISTPDTSAKVVPLRRWVLAIAAGVPLLAIGVWAFFSYSEITVETQMAEKTEVRLPDNSLVKLNASSSISYARWGWEENRSMKLSGEAYFEVEKGSSFVVNTSKGQVTVLGTSFNVKDRNNRLEVFCYTGKVGVAGGGHEEILTPGEGVVLESRIMRKETDTLTSPNWTRGKTLFKNKPLSEVLEELEIQFNVTIIHNNPTMLYTGGFSHSSDIESALKIVVGSINTLRHTKIDSRTYKVENR
ncbi:MAG: FecR domain-containing protein [Bacteroidota bacterium]